MSGKSELGSHWPRPPTLALPLQPPGQEIQSGEPLLGDLFNSPTEIPDEDTYSPSDQHTS